MTTLFCVLYPTLFRADTVAPMVAPTRVGLRATAREKRRENTRTVKRLVDVCSNGEIYPNSHFITSLCVALEPPWDVAEMAETERGVAKALFARLSLLMLNIALFGLGIALAVMGSNEEGTAGLLKSIYANHGVAAFQEPDYAMAVAGAFITLISMQGIVGAMTGHKPTLFAYHTFCLLLLTGVIYASEMTRIYRQEADATIAAYWSRLDPRDMSARDDNLVNYSEDRTKHVAKRWFTDANNVLIAVAVFLAFALVASGSVMGLKYTLKRVGAGANFMGILFGFFLLVLCAVVARATYVVPDALSLDVSVDFPVDADGRAGEPVDAFVTLLHREPWKIFRDDEGAGSSRPHGIDPVPSPPPPLPSPANDTGPPASSTRRLLENGDAADSPPPPPLSPPAAPSPLSPPPPPPPVSSPPPVAPPPPPSPPPWNEAFPARAMWINAVDRQKRSLNGVLKSTVVHFTASFSGVNATGDVDLNATLPPAVRERVARAAVGEDEVVVSNLRSGGTHAYGGAWAAHLLAAAGVLVMLASIAGFVGITTGVTAHLWTHFFFCAFAWSFAVAAAHTLLEHSDDTKRYLANHWQVIQTGVVGENVAAEDAAAFATQHMRAAAALGALCAVFLSVSLAATVAALLVIYGWIGPGAHRRGQPLFRGGSASMGATADGASGTAGAAVAHRRLAREDDDWGDGWGDGWDDDKPRAARSDARASARVGDVESGGGHGEAGGSAPRAAAAGERVEMADLHNMVQEARGGRGRFKRRGGKSSRTPSPERARARSAVPASAAAAKMEEGLLSLFARVTGGVSSGASRGDREPLQNAKEKASSSVFRDEIARPGHSRADVAAAVSMLRAAAARRNPEDPDAALRAALEVAGEGDATLIREALGGGLGGSPRGRARFTLE